MSIVYPHKINVQEIKRLADTKCGNIEPYYRKFDAHDEIKMLWIGGYWDGFYKGVAYLTKTKTPVYLDMIHDSSLTDLTLDTTWDQIPAKLAQIMSFNGLTSFEELLNDDFMEAYDVEYDKRVDCFYDDFDLELDNYDFEIENTTHLHITPRINPKKPPELPEVLKYRTYYVYRIPDDEFDTIYAKNLKLYQSGWTHWNCYDLDGNYIFKPYTPGDDTSSLYGSRLPDLDKCELIGWLNGSGVDARRYLPQSEST